jgi:uncharacterized Ntn-hydrolase superfamily protein
MIRPMKKQLNFISIFCFSISVISAQHHPGTGDRLAYTFSIVAMDPATGEMAVGVQSHWFSVGTIVSWGESGVGVVATQSFVNPAYGPTGLKLMAEGKSAEEALKQLVAADEGRDYRQVAFLDVDGKVSAFTGEKCIAFASHMMGPYYSVQANMMLNEAVVPAISGAFEKNDSQPLAERMLMALLAGQEAGGDIRGRQSAALIVVGPELTANSWEDKLVDLRVEDHQTPLVELSRLLKVHRAYEHMNRGDLAVEQGNMVLALEEYETAESMLPGNLEMKYWKAVTLANNGKLEKALPIFKSVFEADENWRELTIRLPASGLLSISEEELQKVLAL